MALAMFPDICLTFMHVHIPAGLAVDLPALNEFEASFKVFTTLVPVALCDVLPNQPLVLSEHAIYQLSSWN
jgi:hypothetical protein